MVEAFEPHLLRMVSFLFHFEMELKGKTLKIVFGGSCFDIIQSPGTTKKPEQNEIAGGPDQVKT